MRGSIKRQMAIVFIGLIMFTLVASVLVNGVFLEQYYIVNKQEDLQETYEALYSAVEQEKIYDAEIQSNLQRLVEKGNISFIILALDGQIELATDKESGLLLYQLISYQLDKNENRRSVLKKTDDYEICRSEDPRNSTEYIEMWGYFSNGSAFILRTPTESIRESAMIANRFLLYVGTVVVLISALLVWFFAKKLTDPILELAVLSTKMAELDFEARYEKGGNDEIGILGASFNAMSYKLEHTISELKTVNNELLQDIEKKEKMETMRTEFLAHVSHELKTPIALIQGYAEGLKEGIGQDQESRDFYCEVIMDEANKMNQMVRNLLELNQLELGNESINLERFDIVALMTGVLQSLEILIQQKQAKIQFQNTEQFFVWGDQFKVEQVVRNYLTNALNHVQEDRVIEIKIEEQNEKARITVFNTGIPIPEQDIERIWEKFYKVDKARTRDYGGNGIGLSIVKAIMESMHQGYGVNNYDNGVQFWFELDVK